MVIIAQALSAIQTVFIRVQSSSAGHHLSNHRCLETLQLGGFPQAAGREASSTAW
jgi:hypothetical protein